MSNVNLGRTLAEGKFGISKLGLWANKIIDEYLVVGETGFQLHSEKSAFALGYDQLFAFAYESVETWRYDNCEGVTHLLSLLKEGERKPTVLTIWDQPLRVSQRSMLGFMQKVPVSPGMHPAIQALLAQLNGQLLAKMVERWKQGELVGCFCPKWNCVANMNQARILGLSQWLGTQVEIPLDRVTEIKFSQPGEMQISSPEKRINFSLKGWNAMPFGELVVALCAPQ